MPGTDLIKIADSELDLDFTASNIIAINQSGKTLCIAKHLDGLFAFQRFCPHASADLSNGYVDALGNIVCPLHHYKFSAATGRNVTGEGYFLKRYNVEKRDDGIYVELPL